jgi:Taurine catabolism dioxygenase TauD, TfdA family
MSATDTATPIHTEQIHDATAWIGSDFVGKEDITVRLTEANVNALEELLVTTRGLERDAIERSDCSHPELDGDLQAVYEEIMFGRGLVVLAGFPLDDHSLDDIERMYWIVCSHFGRLVSNNSFGHRMVRVQQEILPDGAQPARGTKSNGELAMHNDAADILSLLWVHQAKKGGESQFASGPAAHNAILSTRPDLLPILYRGFPHHRRSEQPDNQPDVTPYDVPIFSNVNGRVCINFTYSSIAPALRVLGRELTDLENEALELLRGVLVRQQFEFRQDRGEAVIGNNFVMCHSRSDFVDGPDPQRRRLLLRAWMEVPLEDRRLPIGRSFFHMENENGRLGYDPVPGREGRIAINDYANVDKDLADMFKAAQTKPKITDVSGP